MAVRKWNLTPGMLLCSWGKGMKLRGEIPSCVYCLVLSVMGLKLGYSSPLRSWPKSTSGTLCVFLRPLLILCIFKAPPTPPQKFEAKLKEIRTASLWKIQHLLKLKIPRHFLTLFDDHFSLCADWSRFQTTLSEHCRSALFEVAKIFAQDHGICRAANRMKTVFALWGWHWHRQVIISSMKVIVTEMPVFRFLAEFRFFAIWRNIFRFL